MNCEVFFSLTGGNRHCSIPYMSASHHFRWFFLLSWIVLQILERSLCRSLEFIYSAFSTLVFFPVNFSLLGLPRLLAVSLQLRYIGLYLDSPSPCHRLETVKTVSWGDLRACLIFFLFLRDHPFLPDVLYFKSYCFIYSVCIFSFSGRRWENLIDFEDKFQKPFDGL